jgi:hypothetical protein
VKSPSALSCIRSKWTPRNVRHVWPYLPNADPSSLLAVTGNVDYGVDDGTGRDGD